MYPLQQLRLKRLFPHSVAGLHSGARLCQLFTRRNMVRPPLRQCEATDQPSQAMMEPATPGASLAMMAQSTPGAASEDGSLGSASAACPMRLDGGMPSLLAPDGPVGMAASRASSVGGASTGATSTIAYLAGGGAPANVPAGGQGSWTI